MDHINHNKLNIFNIKVYIHITFLSSCFKKNFTSEFLQINIIKYINNLMYIDLYFIFIFFLCIHKNFIKNRNFVNEKKLTLISFNCYTPY